MQCTCAINTYLATRVDNHPGRDLVERFLAAGGATTMETQVNVAAGNGEPVEGKRTTYTDGVNSWWNLRIPKDANAEPTWDDYELRYPLELHAEGIGSTGWQWANRRSRWVGFDFDAITGHAKGIGISDDQLKAVAEAAKAIPYVEVRNSTGGKGLHLYVYFDGEGIPTENHTVHAALGRCILGMMAGEVNFDFASQIDACGHVMWLWHKKLTAENQGLALVKPAAKSLAMGDLPKNWRDHIEVVTRRRTKIRVGAVDEKDADPFEALTSARRIVPLDDKHKAVIQALQESGYSTLWIQDHHLLQTHTHALKDLIETDRQTLGLIGPFDTSSDGKDKGTPNCFLFPLAKGGWRVFRFSPGVDEANTWTQDGNGWTTCTFNRLPDFETACKTHGGMKDPESNLFVFPTFTQAAAAAEVLGQKIALDKDIENGEERETRLKIKDGRLVVIVERKKKVVGEVGDPDVMAGWINKKDRWVREFDKRIESQSPEDVAADDFDSVLRSLITPAGSSAGWTVRIQGGEWSDQPATNVKMILQHSGMGKPEAEAVMGGAVKRSWKLVSLPFHPEYPGGRQWNRNAPQFKVEPAVLADDEQPCHPHWDMILNHIGCDLDSAIRSSEQMQRLNIRTGAEYLRLWIACMFREPFEQLPYLFAYGSENCGKSIFHESLSQVLVTGGINKADRVLRGKDEFNGELANAVLCVVEEKSVTPRNASRLRELVTAKTLSIRKMHKDSYEQPSTVHWYQCANSMRHCPVFPGDTRITVINVPDLPKEKEVPKKLLMEKLTEEASHFLWTLLNLELPAVEGRLRLPVIESMTKRQLADDFGGVNSFVEKMIVVDAKAAVLKRTIYEAFKALQEANECPVLKERDFYAKFVRAMEDRFVIIEPEDSGSRLRADEYRALGVQGKERPEGYRGIRLK
jgi:hypothetical protein